jgi:hypothetical protein
VVAELVVVVLLAELVVAIWALVLALLLILVVVVVWLHWVAEMMLWVKEYLLLAEKNSCSAQQICCAGLQNGCSRLQNGCSGLYEERLLWAARMVLYNCLEVLGSSILLEWSWTIVMNTWTAKSSCGCRMKRAGHSLAKKLLFRAEDWQLWTANGLGQ